MKIILEKVTQMRRTFLRLVPAAAAASSLGAFAATASAATAADRDAQASAALKRLSSTDPVAAAVANMAKAVLVFPDIVKAGLIFGSRYGEGVLPENGVVVACYNSVSAS